MLDKLIYFDTSHLARLYLEDPGYREARELAAPCTAVVSAWHAQAYGSCGLLPTVLPRRRPSRCSMPNSVFSTFPTRGK